MTQRVRAASHTRDDVPDFVISVRTVLKDSMISPAQRDRMGVDPLAFLTMMAGTESGRAWVIRNSRPWVATERDDDLLARAS